MTTKTRTKPTPPPPLSARETYDRDYPRWEPVVVQRINWRVEAILAEREQFLANLGESMTAGELARQIAWSESVVQQDFERRAWVGILVHRESGESKPTSRGRLIEALRHYRDEYTRSLVRDFHRQNSTGAFHRACDAAERAAKARVLEELEGYIAEYDRIEEEGAKLGGGA